MEKEDIQRIIRNYLKENLTVVVTQKEDWGTKEKWIITTVKLGEDVIYRIETL